MSGAEAGIRVDVPALIDAGSAAAFGSALRAANDGPARAIVLGGNEGVFCRGLDIRDLAAGTNAEQLAAFRDVLLAVRRSSKPVIAAVDGAALGGGLGLAAAADLVIATEDSSFGLPESLIGLAPAIILPFLLERMTPQQFRFWALTPHSRTAAEAERAGLVDVLTSRTMLQQKVEYWIRQFTRAERVSVGAIKRMTANASDSMLDNGIALTLELFSDPAVLERSRRYE